MKKAFLMGLILFLLVSVVAGVNVAKAVSKPSVPEFTVKFIDSSYTTPTTYSIDPYTGQNVTDYGSYIANKTIEVTVKNQPLVPYYDASSGWYIFFYYNIRVKAYYEENWTNLYLREDIPYLSENVPPKSVSEYTVLSYHSYQPISENTYRMGLKMIDFPPGSQVDFQVEALAGYIHRVYNPNSTGLIDIYPYVFTGESSGWSNTQTITIPDNTSTSASPTSTPTSNPAVTVSLSESASALYFGNTVNFTVSADGGVPPYTFAWHVDGQLAETSNSQYFSTDTQAVGSHHVYVQVTDANNNSATTLTVEFNVLPVSSSSTPIPEVSSSATPTFSPTQQPTLSPTPILHGSLSDLWYYIMAGSIVLVIVIATIVALVYFKKHNK